MDKNMQQKQEKQTNTLTLSLEELVWIGSAFEKKNQISLFSNLESKAPFTSEMSEKLVKQGLINDRDVLHASYYPIFKDLANPKSFVRLMISSPHLVSERIAYFGEVPVFVEKGLHDFTLHYPGNIDILMKFLPEFTGVSSLVNVSFGHSLDFEEAYMLTSWIDFERIQFLKHYSEGTYSPLYVDEADFLKYADKLTPSPKWLSFYLQNYAPKKAQQGLANWNEIKNSFLKKGLLEEKDGKVGLCENLRKFAGNFLVIESVFHLVMGEENHTQVNLSECVILKAGNHDILSIDFGNEKVEIETFSGLYLLDLIGRLFFYEPLNF